MLINIIHPYTFKLTGHTLQIGPCEEYEDRDKRVTAFVRKALDSKTKVLWHKYHDGDPIKHLMHEVSLQSDPLYKFLFDPRIDTVVTTPYGTPIPDGKPESIPQELWNHFIEIYTPHSELQQKIGCPKSIIFIGGVLENCIANAATYFHQHYRRNGQELLYVPELCVSLDKDLLARVKPKFDERDINPINYERAINLLN